MIDVVRVRLPHAHALHGHIHFAHVLNTIEEDGDYILALLMRTPNEVWVVTSSTPQAPLPMWWGQKEPPWA